MIQIFILTKSKGFWCPQSQDGINSCDMCDDQTMAHCTRKGHKSAVHVDGKYDYDQCQY